MFANRIREHSSFVNFANKVNLSKAFNGFTPEINGFTPGSDFLFELSRSELMWGRQGNDTVIGFNPSADRSEQQEIDFLVGDLSEEEILAIVKGTLLEEQLVKIFGEILLKLNIPAPRDWKNRFILGDWQQPYYIDGQGLNFFGLNQFAVIVDFSHTQDSIELHGTPQDYQLLETPLGTAIYWQQGTTPDLVALLPGVFGLSLESSPVKVKLAKLKIHF